MSAPAEDIIFALILAHADLRELVGDRVFPEVAPTGTADPWVVYQRIGNSDANSHDGYNDLTEPLYQVTAWTADARQRKVMRGYLLDIFRMHRETVVATTTVVSVTGDRDLNEDGPPRMYGAAVDVLVSI